MKAVDATFFPLGVKQQLHGMFGQSFFELLSDVYNCYPFTTAQPHLPPVAAGDVATRRKFILDNSMPTASGGSVSINELDQRYRLGDQKVAVPSGSGPTPASERVAREVELAQKQLHGMVSRVATPKLPTPPLVEPRQDMFSRYVSSDTCMSYCQTATLRPTLGTSALF